MMQKSIEKTTVQEAIQQFYTQHDFGEDGGIHNKWVWIRFGFFSIPIPNTSGRSKNIYLHDVNHLVTGLETNWKGESSVSAWEVASGGWGRQYIPWMLTLWAMGLGVIVYPKQVLYWFCQGLTMRNAYTCGYTQTEIFQCTLNDFRQRISQQPSTGKNPYVWMLLAVLFFFLPFAFGFGLLVFFIPLFY